MLSLFKFSWLCFSCCQLTHDTKSGRWYRNLKHSIHSRIEVHADSFVEIRFMVQNLMKSIDSPELLSGFNNSLTTCPILCTGWWSILKTGVNRFRWKFCKNSQNSGRKLLAVTATDANLQYLAACFKPFNVIKYVEYQLVKYYFCLLSIFYCFVTVREFNSHLKIRIAQKLNCDEW